MGRNFRDVPATIDYVKQPLPLIGSWGNYNSTSYGLAIYDSDGLPVSAVSNANYGPLVASEFATTLVQTQTSGSAGNNVSTSAPQAVNLGVKGTASSGVDGNGYFWAGPDTSFGARSGTVHMSLHAYYGVVIGPEGYRQNFSLYQQGYILRQSVRGGNYLLDQFTISAATATLAGVTTTTPGVGGTATPLSQAGAGQIAYHRPLNKLCWLEARDTTTSWRLHVWKNPGRKLTGRMGELARFITEAKAGTNGASYTYLDFTTQSSLAAPEATVRCRLIPLNSDTDYTVVRMYPSNYVEYLAFSVSGPNAMVQTLRLPVGVTTSYGCESGPMYGIRHQVSWDNKWIFAYAPYYYYGCGMVGHFVSLDTPGLSYTLSFTDSVDGMQVLPYGRSGFLVSRSSVNADGGSGTSTCLFDPGSGLQPNGLLSLSSQDAVVLAMTGGQFDTFYASTNFPCIVPIERWSLPNGANANG